MDITRGEKRKKRVDLEQKKDKKHPSAQFLPWQTSLRIVSPKRGSSCRKAVVSVCEVRCCEDPTEPPVKRPGFLPSLYCQVAVWPEPSHLTFLDLKSFTFKVRVLVSGSKPNHSNYFAMP